MGIEAELLGQCSVEQIKKGFIEDKESYTCIMCGEQFEKGEIYVMSGRFYEAYKAMALHVAEAHGSTKDYLLESEAHYMGISELQLQLLNFFSSGMTDKEIAEYLGVSGSTIRNHRYKLKEKERQAKVFLALMEALREEGVMGNASSEANKESYTYGVDQVSEKERKRILENYFTQAGKLKNYPKYEKNKRVVLEAILAQFDMGKQYSELEVHQILSDIYKEEQLLKEELMAYDYLYRTNKGGIYWVKNYEAI